MKPALLPAAALCVLALGCPDRKPAGAPPSPEPSAETRPAEPPPEERARETLEQAAPTPEAARDAPPTQDARAPQGSAAQAPPREWTAGTVDVRRPDLRPVLLRAVRVGRNEGFDRVVFEFDGEALPGYHLEYIDTPVRRCGSGEVTPIAGQGWLSVRLSPAQAHTEAGQPTMAQREQTPKLPVVLEAEQVCDFEGQVEWVLGNRHPNRYRVMELRAPTRLVVDVQH